MVIDVHPVVMRLTRVLTLLVMTLITVGAQAGNDHAVRWLEIDDDNRALWDVSYVDGELPQLRITPRWSPRPEDLRRKIQALVSKKSSSYKLGANALLEVLHQQGIYADVSIANFDKDNARGRELLAHAEAVGADLIFTMGSESAALVIASYAGGRLPVVTAINKDPVALGQMTDYEHGTGNNIAMTSLNVPLALQNAYLFELKPDLKAVALLYNKNHKQVMATEVVPMRAALRKLGLTVVDVAVSAQDTSAVELHEQMPRALRELREADPGLRNSIFWLTSSTAVFSQLSTVVKLADSVPVVSGIPNAVRPGEESAVLSVGIDRRSNARLAAIYASRILRGEVRPGELKLGVVTPPDIAINFGVANRLDLRMPFRFLESASFVYGYDYEPLRSFGRNVVARR